MERTGKMELVLCFLSLRRKCDGSGELVPHACAIEHEGQFPFPSPVFDVWSTSKKDRSKNSILPDSPKIFLMDHIHVSALYIARSLSREADARVRPQQRMWLEEGGVAGRYLQKTSVG